MTDVVLALQLEQCVGTVFTTHGNTLPLRSDDNAAVAALDEVCSRQSCEACTVLKQSLDHTARFSDAPGWHADEVGVSEE